MPPSTRYQRFPGHRNADLRHEETERKGIPVPWEPLIPSPSS